MPPQLFITSLGACFAVLVTNFCNHHTLDATGLSVDVSYDMAKHPTRMTNIVVDVHLPSANCDDECTRNAVESVAEHCPVHETIATLKDIQFNIYSGQP